jgi:hypothetical protein
MPEIEKRAEDLRQRGLLMLNTSGILLPKAVRNLLADLLCLVAEMAKGKP